MNFLSFLRFFLPKFSLSCQLRFFCKARHFNMSVTRKFFLIKSKNKVFRHEKLPKSTHKKRHPPKKCPELFSIKLLILFCFMNMFFFFFNYGFGLALWWSDTPQLIAFDLIPKLRARPKYLLFYDTKFGSKLLLYLV